MRKGILLGASVVIGSLLGAGCQPLLLSKPINDTKAQDGLIYYLPKYLYSLSVIPGDLVAKLGESEIAAVEPYHAFQPPTRPDPFAVTEIATVATINVPKTAKCPKGAVITIKGPIAVGDEKTPILLSRADATFLTEELGIVLSPSGIIRSADSLTSGQLDEVLRILAQIAMTAATGVPVPKPGSKPPALQNQEQRALLNNGCIEKTVVRNFDPTQNADLDELYDGNKGVAKPFTLTPLDKNLKPQEKPLNETDAYSGISKTPVAGIYYRALETRFVRFSTLEPPIDIELALPTPTGKLGFVKYTGTLFSDDNGTATRFKDGVPVSYDFKSNSEAVALLNVPLDILNAVIQLPMNILTFRIQELTAEKNFTTAQKDLLTAVLDFKAKQDEANKKSSEPPAGEGAGGK